MQHDLGGDTENGFAFGYVLSSSPTVCADVVLHVLSAGHERRVRIVNMQLS